METELYCFNCNKNIERKISNKDKTENKTGRYYCSRSCAAKSNNQLIHKRKLTKKCKKCENLIQSSRVYCKNCQPFSMMDYKTLKIKDIKAKNIYAKHSTIRKHSRKLYIKSNKPMKCINCGYSKHVEIAHIKPITDFDENTLILTVNSTDNLVAFCRNCHWEFDNGLLTL